jgi:hypothetical protein
MLSLSTAATVLSLFVVIRKHPQYKETLLGFPWPPLVYVFFTLLIAGLAAINEPREMLAALVTLICGVIMYLLINRKAKV